MPYSYNEVGAKGPGDTIPVPFEFLDPEHVSVKVDGVVTENWSWINNGLISCDTGFPTGVKTRVFRTTPRAPLEASLQGASVFDWEGVNLNDIQMLFIVQEQEDAEAERQAQITSIEEQGWFTKDGGQGGTITKGTLGQLAQFDADGNMVPTSTIPNPSTGEGLMLKSVYDPDNTNEGAMFPSKYDPTGKDDDAFDRSNFHTADPVYDPAGLLTDVFQMHNHRPLRILDIAGKSIKSVVGSLMCTGYSLHGDGGHCVMVRRGTPSVVKPWHYQSVDGSWWEPGTQEEYSSRIFGLGSGGVVATSFADSMDFITTRGGTLVFPAGVFDVPNYSFNAAGGPKFKLRGAGKFITIFRKSAAATGAYWNFGLCDGLEISDLTINAQKSVVGIGSHGLRINQGSNVAIRRVHVTDWTDTAIIFFNAGDLEAQHEDIVFDECSADGLNAANNGFLMSNTLRGRMYDCHVKGLNKLGDPSFGLQFKGRNTDGLILGGSVNGARAGVAMGSSDPVYPSNKDCHAIGVSVHGCTRGARLGASEYCSISLDTIDMDNASDAGNPVEDAPEHAVYIFNCTNCVVNVKHIRGYEDADFVVYMGTAQGNVVTIDTWRDIPQNLNFLKWDTGASGNTLIVKNFVGSRPDFWMDRVTDLSGSINTFIVQDDVMAQRNAIVSDAVTVRNPAVNSYRLDTEAAAATDSLKFMSAGQDGQLVYLTITNTNRKVTMEHMAASPPAGFAQLFLKGAVNRQLATINDTALVRYNTFANTWQEV